MQTDPNNRLFTMKILCLGGAGVVCRHAAKDLIESPDVQEVAIGETLNLQ